MRTIHVLVLILGPLILGFPAACGDDDGTEADRRGIGSSCTTMADCSDDDQQCLAFKGGYCGLSACTKDEDCPEASACVAHTDGKNYCFRICGDKVECNRHRALDVEANCSSSVTFVAGDKGRKACVPPSS